MFNSIGRFFLERKNIDFEFFFKSEFITNPIVFNEPVNREKVRAGSHITKRDFRSTGGHIVKKIKINKNIDRSNRHQSQSSKLPHLFTLFSCFTFLCFCLVFFNVWQVNSFLVHCQVELYNALPCFSYRLTVFILNQTTFGLFSSFESPRTTSQNKMV